MVVVEKFFEGGIRQVHASLPVENSDAQRAILNQGIQISGLFIQIQGQAVSLTDLRADDKSNRRLHQHEQGDLCKK